MNTKIQILRIIAIILVGAIALGIISEVLPIQTQDSIREFLINIRIIRVPEEKDLEELEKCYNEVKAYLDENALEKDEIVEIYDAVQASVVSSIANTHYNMMEEKYKSYQERLKAIKKQISKFEKKYNQYIRLLENIPDYSVALKEEKYAEFEEIIVPMHEDIDNTAQSYRNDEEAVEETLLATKKIADDLFDRDYYDLTIICYYEARGCPDLEIAYVAKVIENRIASPKFSYAHNAHDVIYAPLQYEPTWTTSMNQTDARVQKVVEDFLRGKIDTEMPDNVLYQARFQQPGKEIWKITDSGEYFCYG